MENYFKLQNSLSQPQYYYKVEEIITTFGKDVNSSPPYFDEFYFDGPDFLANMMKTRLFYYKRIAGLNGNRFHLPFSSPTDFKIGENAAASITLYFVVVDGDNHIQHALEGEDDETTEHGKDIELEAFNKLYIKV